MNRVTLTIIFVVYIIYFSSVISGQDIDLRYEEIIEATTVSNVNLRGDPSTTNPAIGTLAQGEQVTILEEIPDGQSVSGNTLWYRVQLPDESEAFIWSELLTEPEIISRRCITYIEDYTDNGNSWLVSHGTVWLHEFNVSRGTIERIQVSTTPTSWNTSVSLEELMMEIMLPENMTTEIYIDELNCRVTGGVVVTQDGDASYVPVRNGNGEEIRFLYIGTVSQIYRPENLLPDTNALIGGLENVNEDFTPDTIRNNFEYSETYGGYIRNTGDFIIVYRRFLDIPSLAGARDGEATIMSEVGHPELGTITYEQIHNMNGLNISQRPQARFNDNAELNMPNGLRTFFLVAYQNVYLVSEKEAEQFLANNAPLPLSWQSEFTVWAQGPQHFLSNHVADVRYYLPQSGVSFVVIDQGYDIIPGSAPSTVQYFPALAMVSTTFDDEPGHTYGFDVESNGRLVIYIYEPYEYYQDSTPEIFASAINSSVIQALYDAYRFTIDVQNTPRRISMWSTYHMGWNNIESGSAQEQIRMAFGYRSVDDYEELWSQISDLSADERREYFKDQQMFEVTVP